MILRDYIAKLQALPPEAQDLQVLRRDSEWSLLTLRGEAVVTAVIETGEDSFREEYSADYRDPDETYKDVVIVG